VSLSPPIFHPKKGSLVTVTQNNKTATRNNATQEFNHGLVLSSFPLQDNQMFEVKIDKKINSWSGSIEVGVTCCDPNGIETPFPSSATELREGTWIMSGNSVLKDGRSINENYGTDLDKLEEGDRVGVLRTGQGDLIFFVNGVSQGVAATNLSPRVFAVVDMYGKCAQVTIMDNTVQEARIHSNDLNNVATAAAAASIHLNTITSNNSINNITNANIQAATAAANAAVALATTSGIAAASISGLIRENSSINNSNNSRIRFHQRHGSLIKLGNNNRTSERKRPFDEFNNGVVMTHRNLQDNEMFEIRLDRLVDKWSGSIEVGVTTHNPGQLDFPATMTNLRNGTTMMSGAGILTNGKGTRREYGQFNLDELAEGDRIGMMRRSNGNLHYFINGQDQGVAASRVSDQVWGVVDLYGMTVKVTIVDRDERDEQNLITRRNLALRMNPEPLELQPSDKLMFHTACGSHAAVINSGITSHRPNAADDFNFGVVLTNRPIKTNEVFEVRLDKMVSKWAGSIEIGVTTHAPSDLEFPSTMTNIRSGTWMMTGNGVMHNGTTTIDDYGQNLDKLKVGDRVGVVRKDSGVLHFFVNGEDQGPAASNVPDRVYGVIDLYGQAAQATIVDGNDFRSPDGLDSTVTSGTLYSNIEYLQDLRFHHLHGRNARISNSGVTASRQNALSEFNDAIVMSNRPMREGEMFEIQVERMVDRWSGSIEAGVTLIKPEELQFPNTMTDIDYDTWMLSGSAVMKDGNTVKNSYGCDLDALNVGYRLGMMRTCEGALHYYINGEDQGVAIDGVPAGVYAVIDLYGVCAQVSVINRSGNRTLPAENSLASSQVMESSQVSIPLCAENSHRFCSAVGGNVELTGSYLTGNRKTGPGISLLFSSQWLDTEEWFEVRIDTQDTRWSGSLRVGLTTLNISDGDTNKVPAELSQLECAWVLDGSTVLHNNQLTRMNYGSCLDRLGVGDKVGVKRTADGHLRFSVNGEDCGTAATNIPVNTRAVVDLAGHTTQVSVSSVSRGSLSPVEEFHNLQDSLEDILESKEVAVTQQFSQNRGRNTFLSHNNTVARRTESYNQGIVASLRPLQEETLFQICITKLNSKWSSSLALGVVGFCPDRLHLPVSLVELRRECWVVAGEQVYHNGVVTQTRYGPNLDALSVNHSVGVLVDKDRALHVVVNGVDQGVAARDLPNKVWAVFDLYGMCEEVAIAGSEGHNALIAAGTEGHSALLPENFELKEHVSREKWNDEEERSSKLSKDAKNSMTSSQLLPPSPAAPQLLTSCPQLLASCSSPTAQLTEMLSSGTSRRNCDYMNVCTRFKNSLGLPAVFFEKFDAGVCYCETCHKLRGCPSISSAGNPPTSFTLPLRWVLYPLRAREDVREEGEGEKEGRDAWHIAYHATNVGHVRPMLDAGSVLTVGELGLQRTLEKEKSKLDDTDAPLISFSPNIVEAVTAGGGRRFLDKRSRREYSAKIAFMLEVEPGSYKVGGQEEGGRENLWVTKERGNTNITALLINLDQI